MATLKPPKLSAAVASFADFLQQARTTVGDVNLPANLSPAFETVFSTKDAIDTVQLDALLSIVDGDGGALFNRLDARAGIVFAGLLRLAREGQSQQRGYFMLAEYLYEYNATGHPPKDRPKATKTVLGPRHIVASLNRFLNPDRSYHTRRAIGLFVLTLLSDSPPNKEILVRECNDETWCSLGSIILSHESEMLKLLAGSIIREMLHHKVPEEKFWPTQETPAVVVNSFPRAAAHTSQWIWSFHSYLKKDILQDAVYDWQEVSTFAQLVRLPDLEFAADDESSILMTVTTMLSIMIPPSKTRPITYLDVPLDRITEISPVKLDSQSQARSQHSQSQTIRPCCLEIGLNNLQGWNHVLNAKSRHADSVVVLFDYTQDAKMIHDAILARRSTPFQTVSPGDLEYEGKASNEEAIIHESDPIMLDLPEIDTGEVAATHVNQLAAMASDAISRVPCSGASNDVHERSVDVGYDGRTNVNGPQPSGTQNQLALNNTDGIGDSVREMVPANHDSNIGRPRAPTNPSLEAKQNAPLDNGASGGAGNSINTRDRQHTQQSAMQSPSLGHPRQKEDDYNSMYDLSPLKPKGKPLAQATMMPAVEGLTTNQHTDSSRRGSRKLSRQLRDRNGKVQDIDHGQCLTAEVPFVQSDKSLHQRTLEQRSSSTTIKPKASNIGTSRKVGMKAKLVGQQRKALPVSTHDEEYTPTVTTGHKATRVVQAPKAKMVAGSKKREPRKPSNVSASSDPRPDLKDQAAGISQTVSPSKAKFQHSVAVEEEEVDWSEDLQVDYSDITTKAKKKKTLQPQASQVRVQEKKKSLQPEARAAKVSEKKKTLQPQARATKTQERKLTPTQQRKEVPSRPTVNVQSSKPKRAAALKASTKIQGLSDNFKKKQSPIKDAATKESFKPTPVSDGAVSAAKIGKSGLDTSALQTRSDTSPKNFSPSSSAYTRGPFPTIKAPKEKAIADFSSQKTAESIRERDPTPKPVATSVAAKDKSVEPRAMSKSEHVGHISIDHGLDQEVVGDSLPANEEAAQPIFEASVEQDNLNNLMHHTEGNMAANTIDFNQLSELYNADSSPSPMVQQVLIAPMDTGNVPGAIIPAPSSNARVQAEIQGVHEKRRAVSPPARSVSLPDPLAERYIDAKVKSGKHPGPQDDHCSKNRQHQQVITQADAPQLGEMDHQNQSEFEDGSKKSPPAPKKKRFTASMLQAALSPLLVLPTRKPDQNSAPITQVVNELADHVEQETVAKANGAISILNVPIARKRHAKQKRYLEEDDTRQSKKSRASGWKPSSGPYSARSIIVTPKDSGSNVHRKPRLVHFGSDGPKNQGIQSAQKDAMRDGSRSREKQIDMPHELALSSKRKHVSLTDEQCIAADSTPNEKRRKMNAEKPSLSWKEEDRTVAQRPDKSIATGGYGKPSSQSSRVTEHGSPMPFHHSRRASLRAPVATLALHEASDEEPIACQTDINNELEPQLPIAAPYHKLPSIPEPKIIVASNTKHRPSSPNAPSSIVTDMAAHRVQPSGHFVEIQTNSVVVPTNPQDPFTGATKDRPYNHFTETLRKSGDMQSKETKQSRNEQHEKKIPSDGRKDDDPDKTLIGESLSEDERKSSTASGSSSGSNSSESPGEADVEPSDNGSDPGSEWLRGLRADHRDTLDALYEINHQLVRDLIDKETAIADLINDYHRGGHLRIDRYEEERDRKFEHAIASKEKAKRELVELFQSEERNCAAQAGSSDKAVADLRSGWEAREQKMNASLDAALALCEEL